MALMLQVNLFIVLTLDDGIVFKCIENKLKSQAKLGLYSLNSLYHPYTVDAADIKEIWKFVHYISPELPQAYDDNAMLHQQIANLNEKVDTIIGKLKV